MPQTLAPDDRMAVVGHYELRRRLGGGGFGQVYEAWDRQLHRHVALKCLTTTGANASSEQLIREARLAASLHHRAFVRIFGFEDNGRSQFIVMELVRGVSLQSTLADYRGEPSRALDIVDQVAAAMAEAHAAGLVHGDLKPGNLMVEADGTVRILDFGLARHIDPLATQTGVPEDPLGTIAYMAPERLAGMPTSAATDIYALGVVLYQLVNGERPHATLHGLALASAHMHGSSHQWRYPGDIAPGLLQLILAMTARDTSVRLPNMEAVRGRIALLRETPVSSNIASSGITVALASTAPVLPLPTMPTPRRGRGRRVALLLAGAILAGALGVVSMAVTAPTWFAPLAPYSESAAMQAGMEALRHVDRDGQIEQALASFEKILAHTPGHAGATAGQSLAYSMRYSRDGRDELWLKRATSTATTALEADDQLALAHAAQAWVAALQGRANDALAAGERASALDPSDTFGLSARIYVLLRLQRFDAAGPLIAQARKRWPRDRVFIDWEGTMAYQRGDYAAAEQAFRRSILVEPDAVQPYANLSAALLRQARSDEALATLQEGLRITPSGILYGNLGTALFDRGDFVGASAAFERAVSEAKGGPNDYLKWANLADARRWLPGREQAANDAYRRAMQLLQPILARSPDDPTFLTRMGLYAAHVGDTTKAVALSARGVAAAPASPDVHLRAALVNELSGRRSVALVHLERAVELGYPFSSIESNPELVALRRDVGYQTLAMKAKR